MEAACETKSHDTAKDSLEFVCNPGWHRTHAPPASGSWKQLVRGLGLVEGIRELHGGGDAGREPDLQAKVAVECDSQAPPLP